MKKNILFLGLLLLLSCEKENPDYNNTAYGISNIGSSNPNSFVELNLINGTYLNRGKINDFEGLKYSSIHARSFNQNIYIYNVDQYSIGLLNLSSLMVDKIALWPDTTLSRFGALVVDEEKNILFVIANTYNSQSVQHRMISITPVNLITKEILPEINFAQEVDTGNYYCVADIDYIEHRIFIKVSGTILYIYNYQSNILETKVADCDFMDINYDSKKNCLFGTCIYLNDGFYLVSYNVANGKILKMGKYKDVSMLPNDCFYYNKITSSYWIGLYNSLNNQKNELLKIDLNDASVTERFAFEEFINNIE